MGWNIQRWLATLFSFTLASCLLILFVGFAQTGAAAATANYTIDTSGGNCSQIGAWDSSSLSCTLASDMTVDANGIELADDGISLNGGGFSLTGPGAGGAETTYGVHSEGYSNLSVSNLNISGFYYGVNLVSSTGSTISDNTVTDSNIGIATFESSDNSITGNQTDQNRVGILLTRSSDSSVADNSAEDNTEAGISLLDSQNNSITDNQSSGNGTGLRLTDSGYNSVQNNLLQQNQGGIDSSGHFNNINSNNLDDNVYYGLTVSGDSNSLAGNIINGSMYGFSMKEYPGFSGTISPTNLVDGKAIYYFSGLSHALIDAPSIPNPYTIICQDCVDVEFRGFTIDGGYDGVVIMDSQDVSVSDAEIFVTNTGIKARNSSVTISGSDIVGSDDLIKRGVGISLYNAQSSRIEDNTITELYEGIRMNNLIYSYPYSTSGINVIWGNDIVSNVFGINLEWSSDNTIAYNNIAENHTGILFEVHSSNNVIYRNHFISNGMHIGVTCYSKGCGLAGPLRADNILSIPAPEGGNYWGDWTGHDANGDGFLDNPRVTQAGIDLLPLSLSPPPLPNVDDNTQRDQLPIDKSLNEVSINDLKASNQSIVNLKKLPDTGFAIKWLFLFASVALGIAFVYERNDVGPGN